MFAHYDNFADTESMLNCIPTGGPNVVFDFADYVMSSADKAMYENTLNITLNRSCIKDLKKNVLLYVCLTLF